MPTSNIVLTDQQHEFVESLVQSGRYQDASEVLREGLRLVQDREREEAAKLRALRAAADHGWADIAAGRYTDLDDDSLEDFIRRLGAQAASRIAPPPQ